MVSSLELVLGIHDHYRPTSQEALVFTGRRQKPKLLTKSIIIHIHELQESGPENFTVHIALDFAG
jgi:hypothetical protein